MPEFQIGNRDVGPEHAPLVIAEIGINHNGDINIAKEMVDAASEAGAEVVKFQSHVVEDEMSHHAKSTIPGNADISIYDIMDSCALTEDEEREIKAYVEEKGMIFLCTPFSRAAANRLEKLGVLAYKIGSGECNNYPLVDHIASFGKPVICSTGMNTIESIRKTVEIFHKYNTPFALLHCTNIYPTPPELVRYGGMQEMMEAFPDEIIGLSDHTLNNAACLGAVALGASILERHFTDRMDREGPDIICSMDPQALSDLIQQSAEVQKMRGGTKAPAKEEQPTIDFAYASVVSITDIKAGEKLTKENLWVKRPGTGEILAERYEELIGKTAKNDIAKDEQLKWDDVA